MPSLLVMCGVYMLLACVAQADEPTTTSSTVGMPCLIEQKQLPGSELEVKPLDRDAPIVVRIVDTFPHGSDFRYDIEFYALESGEYDLTQYLQRIDGSSTDELKPIPVMVTSILPADQTTPNELAGERLPTIGGYSLLLVAGMIVWPFGLILIILWVVRGFIKPVETKDVDERVPVAERLKPLVEAAIRGELERTEQARLERTLVMFWRDRLNLAEVNAVDALQQLREHPEAGTLLRQLENWLHQPPSRREDVDVAELLAPYRTPAGIAPDAEKIG